MADETYTTGFAIEQGALRAVVRSGGSLDVESGGEIDVESGGALKINGTALTGTAAELNKLAGVTAGTVTASKAVVVGANKNLDTLVIADGGLYLGAGAGTSVTSTAAELNKLDGAAYGTHTITVGAEGGNVIAVTIQLKDANAVDLAVRGNVKAYLSNDANGDSLITTAPTGGCAIGTDGLLIPMTPALTDALMVDGGLAIDAVPEKFSTTQTAAFLINGVSHTKAITTALTFTAAHVITASKFGIILVQINAAGTVSTKVPVTPQAYDNAGAALAALPAVDAGNVSLGYIAIENNAGDWTANTDDLTNASDVTTAAFTDSTEVAIGAPKAFELVSESDGDIDINITESGVKTMYLILVNPNGGLVPSGAIAFT